MSWIVQNLWNNRERIRNKSVRHYGISYNFSLLYGVEKEIDDEAIGYNDPFIENDEFNDLLVVEKAIEELNELGLLSQHDLEVLERSGEGIYNNENRQRKAESKHFYSVCERIAYYLGGYFTDDGYIYYITRKYKLTPEQQDIAREYMKSKFKNKTLNKTYRKETNNDRFRLVSIEVQA